MEKFIVIGFPKTGTTSIEYAMKELGFRMGNQRAGELLLEDWGKRNFNPIIELVKTAEVFQDTPFSLPFTFQVIETIFPNAKFILSVRDSAEIWYNSLIRFHSKLWGKNGRIPTEEDLKNAPYIFKGRAFIANQLIWGCPADDPYNKDILMKSYEAHIANVRQYFKHIPKKLIEINVGQDDDYTRMCNFCNRTPVRKSFPWLNRTI